MSPRSPNSFHVLQLSCAFLLLHHSNWQASMVSGTAHLQSSTRVQQHKFGDLLGDEVTACDRILNTDFSANLTECRTKASKLFPGYDQLSECKRDYSEFLCQIEIACQHCDDQLKDWLTNTQTSMNDAIKGDCKDSAGQFAPSMCPITVAPTTNLTTTSTTHNSTSRAPFPKWAIYTLVSGVIVAIVLVFLILWYGWSRSHKRQHESDSKQSLKSTRTHKSSSSRGSGSQANQHQHTAKSLKWYPPKKATKKAAIKKIATPTLKKASSGKVASRGKVTTSSPRRHEAKQQLHHGPKMVNPKQKHSTGNVKKGH